MSLYTRHYDALIANEDLIGMATEAEEITKDVAIDFVNWYMEIRYEVWAIEEPMEHLFEQFKMSL